MENNLDKVAKDLYGKIQARFPEIKIGDENAEVLTKKSDIPNARFFEFEYTEGGSPLGTIAITLDEDDGIVIQISGELSEVKKSHNKAYRFLRSFRKFAKTHLLKFDIQNIGKSNLDKRDYQFQAKKKELPIMENKMFGTSRISYQPLGEARLIIKHSRPINTDLPAGRSMHIESIYVENADGERFKYPYKHLNGARALAEHIKHGGNPYDPIGKHITGLSEELAQLRKFKNYVGRQQQIHEALGPITSRVIERIEEVKKEVDRLQRSSYYEEFAENFQERSEQIIPEEVKNDWIDRLTVRTFNEELTAAFPYLYNIIDESSLPVLELTADDLLGEDSDEECAESDMATTPAKRLRPELAFENFIEQLVNEDKDELLSPEPGSQNRAIERLNVMLASELAGGDEGVLAFKGILDDPEIMEKVRVLDSDEEIRAELKDYLLDKHPKLILLLPNLDEKPSPIGGEHPSQEPMSEPAQQPMPEPAPAPAQPEMGTVTQPQTPPVPAGQPVTPMAESVDKKTKLKAKFIKAKAAGAKLDTKFSEGMTVRDAIREAGLSCTECGYYEEESQDQQESGVNQLLKVIIGFWNNENHNFTIGGEKAKIKVIKAFKDGECPNATPEDVKKVLRFINIKDPSVDTDEPAAHNVISEPTVKISTPDKRVDSILSKIKIMQEDPLLESEFTAIMKNAGLLK